MTIQDAISQIDNLKPNKYTNNEKIAWLSSLDGQIKKTIIDVHEGGADTVFNGYTPSTATTTVLLVPYPFDIVYVSWLEAQIDYYNEEYARYNNAITRFNEELAEFRKDYTRNHMPLKTKIKYF